MANLIRRNKLRLFHSTFRFIDKLFALHCSGKFVKAFVEIYPTWLELKLEYNGIHATLLDFHFSIDKGKFIYKMFDKWYSLQWDKFLKNHNYLWLPTEFLSVATNILYPMINVGCRLLKQIKKAYNRHPEAF